MRRTLFGLLVVAGALSIPQPVEAQMSSRTFRGAATGHLGWTGADEQSASFTLGGSVAVVEELGWGAEFDFGSALGDGGRDGQAEVQSYMLNLGRIWPKGTFRPFAFAGFGVLRFRGCVDDCLQTGDWTDWGYTVGLGTHYLFNDTFGVRGDVRYFAALADHPDPSRPRDVAYWRVAFGVSYLWSIAP
jgi:opacity protein-like surface antigen